MISAVKDDRFSLSEGLKLVLPARFSKKRDALQPRYYSYLREKASQEGKEYMSKRHPEIYDSGFRGFTDYETMELVDQVIDSDQYCTKRFLTKEDANIIDAGANIGISLCLPPARRLADACSLSNRQKRHTTSSFRTRNPIKRGMRQFRIGKRKRKKETFHQRRKFRKYYARQSGV